MSQTLLPGPPPPGEPVSSGFPRLRGPIQLGLLTSDLDAESIFATLHRAVAMRSVDRDVVLGAIAEAAQALTSAQGAALAIQCDGAVVCRARSGENTPELGARLSLDSGISGECLRTGAPLQCDDTQSDPRVNAEVCHHLGLRSIAIVPLHGHGGPTGILEVFSTRAHAFVEEHMGFLTRLAQLAEAVQERQLGSACSTADSAVTDRTSAGSFTNASTIQRRPLKETPAKDSRTIMGTVVAKPKGPSRWKRAGNSLQVQLRPMLRSSRGRLAALGILALILVSVIGLRARRTTGSQNVSANRKMAAQAGASIVPASGSQEQLGADMIWKPSPSRVGMQNSFADAGHAVQRASRIEPAEIIGSTEVSSLRAAPHSGGSLKIERVPVSQKNLPENPPQLSPLPDSNSNLASMLYPAVTLPPPNFPVSQGVSGGALKHRVDPVYPAEALRSRLEGRVVLQASVGEDGSVQDLKVISGSPILARAALPAVRQWKYSPFLLNGKPIRSQTEITISFKVP